MSGLKPPPGCICREYVGDVLKCEDDCPVHGIRALAPSTLQLTERDARRVRAVDVDSRVLLRTLGFPDDAILVDIQPHPQKAATVSFLIAHPTFAPIERGCVIPTIAPTFKSNRSEYAEPALELVSWNDPIPTGGN